MRLRRRLADALRSPARLAAFVRRAVDLARGGELRSTLARLHPRSFDDDAYRAWHTAASRATPRSEAPLKWALLLDAGDAASLVAMRADAAGIAPGAVAVLAREHGTDRWQASAGGKPAPLVELLAAIDAEWLLWVSAPVAFAPGALAAFAAGCVLPGALLVYADSDEADRSGRRHAPRFRSAWDVWQVLEANLAGPVLALHRTLAPWIEGRRRAGEAGPWSALLRASAALPPASVVHVPQVLVQRAYAAQRNEVDERRAVAEPLREAAAHRGLALEANARTTPWVRYHGSATVSVVVPTRDRAALLERCLKAVADTRGRLEVDVVVLDNGSREPAVRDVLEAARRTIEVTVVDCDEPFNFARLANAGVLAAKGRVVVLLNNDTVVTDGWLDELVGLAMQPGVGAVGPLLVYPDGRLQSAGVLVGVNRTATSALAGFDPGDPAAVDWCSSRRRVSAVLGACIAIERERYLQAGGMDERLAVSHNEVDLGLRLDANGLANLFTPFARVVHDEGATRGFEVTREERARLDAEEHAFRERWAPALASCDPAYHPALARTGVPFALGEVPQVLAPRAGWTRGDADAQGPVVLPLECGPASPPSA